MLLSCIGLLLLLAVVHGQWLEAQQLRDLQAKALSQRQICIATCEASRKALDAGLQRCRAWLYSCLALCMLLVCKAACSLLCKTIFGCSQGLQAKSARPVLRAMHCSSTPRLPTPGLQSCLWYLAQALWV